jgi:hypothetical protein
MGVSLTTSVSEPSVTNNPSVELSVLEPPEPAEASVTSSPASAMPPPVPLYLSWLLLALQLDINATMPHDANPHAASLFMKDMRTSDRIWLCLDCPADSRTIVLGSLQGQADLH